MNITEGVVLFVVACVAVSALFVMSNPRPNETVYMDNDSDSDVDSGSDSGSDSDTETGCG